MELDLKIDVVNNISSNDFKVNYYNKNIPVVLKGIASNTLANQKWTLDYFKNTIGNEVVDIYDNGNKNNANSAFTKADLKMKFADFIDVIAKDEHTGLRMFLCNLFKIHPALRDEFPCPKLFKGMLDSVGFMFFGGKNTTVRIHYDLDVSCVLHTHFGGSKRVVLIAPEYSKLLYRLPLNTYSLIDLDKPDYDKYPGLKFVKGYDFILEHGDSIFMPAGYWHYMTYLNGSFSVSYRKLSPNIKHAFEGLLYLGLMMPLDKLLNKVLGKSWLKTKNNIAQKRADAIINKFTLAL
jgi:hypothetical protein